MARRSSSRSKIDDLAFPVRLKIAVPADGLGPLVDRMHAWLGSELGSDNQAVHGSAGLGANAMAVYFRRLEDAQRFLDAHPDARLADFTDRRSR